MTSPSDPMGERGHTELPWRADQGHDGAFAITVPGKVICSRSHWPLNAEQSAANAAFIVQAANSFYPMLSALEFILNHALVRLDATAEKAVRNAITLAKSDRRGG